jgi:hypothetical protein
MQQLTNFNLQSITYYYKTFTLRVNLYNKVLNNKLNSLSRVAAGGEKHATTHVARVDTTLSPKLGVTQEGHCQPGTDPTPRTSQKGQTLAMQGCPWGSRRLCLKIILARLSILILSKAYTGFGIL